MAKVPTSARRWLCDHAKMTARALDGRSLTELTQLVFGEALTFDQVFERLDVESGSAQSPDYARSSPGPDEREFGPVFENAQVETWVGSIGYERYKLSAEFAAHLRRMGVERLIDVRQLPISRRRGFAKSALGAALAAEGVEYVHIRGLGNPKPTRDLYKSGRTAEGRAEYQKYLLTEQREALSVLAEQVHERRCALMCVEHDSSVCHRDVIFDALRNELGVALDIAEIG